MQCIFSPYTDIFYVLFLRQNLWDFRQLFDKNCYFLLERLKEIYIFIHGTFNKILVSFSKTKQHQFLMHIVLFASLGIFKRLNSAVDKKLTPMLEAYIPESHCNSHRNFQIINTYILIQLKHYYYTLLE